MQKLPINLPKSLRFRNPSFHRFESLLLRPYSLVQCLNFSS